MRVPLNAVTCSADKILQHKKLFSFSLRIISQTFSHIAIKLREYNSSSSLKLNYKQGRIKGKTAELQPRGEEEGADMLMVEN